MHDVTKKRVLAAAAAGAMMLGATQLSSAESMRGTFRGKSELSAASKHVKHVRSHRYVTERAPVYGSPRWQNAGPLALPFAAVEGAGAVAGAAIGTAGAIVGGTTAAVTGGPYAGYPFGYAGYPYGYNSYNSYAYAPNGYNSYAYAPGAYGAYDAYAAYPAGGYGLSRDIGHSFYNGVGSPAPASQDNCAVDGGYGRKDYSIAC